jgi:circadian clock protein KaiA
LHGDRYQLHFTESEKDFFKTVEQYQQQLDCLVVQEDRSLLPTLNYLQEQGILLPVVIFTQTTDSDFGKSSLLTLSTAQPHTSPKPATHLFHSAEVRLDQTQGSDIKSFIDQAIAQFLNLAPTCILPEFDDTDDLQRSLSTQNFIQQQQRRLSDKLQERLGYLGVYYKRNPQQFLRHLPDSEKQQLLEHLEAEYRQILLDYFLPDNALNQKIDNFVDRIFFADVPVSHIVEIHMELIEEFSKQLQLENRSEDILLDYRLTLIDIIAHLCEMYRRSIPREQPMSDELNFKNS